MDSSHNPYVYGAAVEGCNSSESGWTMYIGSSAGESDEEIISFKKEYDEDNYININHHSINIKHGDDSDDSMVSDASSGPSHKGQSWEITSSTGGRKKCEPKGSVHHHRRSSYRDEAPAKKYVKGNEEEVKFVGNSVKKVGKNHGFGKRK